MFTPEHLLSLFTRAPKAFFRFDVDFSLDAAVRTAEFAETAGATGTFYIMPTSPFYNPFSPAGVRAIEQIAEHGHRVGVHADERLAYEHPAGLPLASRAASEAAGLFDAHRHLRRIIETYLVSFHMPTDAVLWHDEIVGFASAYASEWKGRYVSDSRREWDADKEARLTANHGEGMQCCLHPEHWPV